MDIMEILSGLTGNQKVIKQLNKSVGGEPEKVEKAVQIGIPLLMEALNRNTNNPEGAQSLVKALEKHQDDKVDDLFSFFSNVDTQDGAKMLQHIFSNKNELVQKNLSKTTGLQQDQIGSLLSRLAPLLLGALGNQKKAQNLDANGISNLTALLSQNLQQSSGGSLFSLATKLLDANKNGSFIDDLFRMLFRKK
ncbi:MAG: DUF937 domain-containing protein [Atribacterota bacterium]|jgi:hypothetical protein|nr:DUF937 domain-containing protein [Atribacterota bacterium]MDD4896439.1 DUF937 domain-containing protein [Atribacterota bacterium]MDD5637241.1 DUF937 domain-containing protein [Atribacterota bacterium]